MRRDTDAIRHLTGYHGTHLVEILYFAEADDLDFEDLTGGKIRWDADLYDEATNRDNAVDAGYLDDMRAALTAVRALPVGLASFAMLDHETSIDVETGFATGDYGGFVVDREYGIPVSTNRDRGVAVGCDMADADTVRGIVSGDIWAEVVTVVVRVDGMEVHRDTLGGLLPSRGYGAREAAKEHGLDAVDVGEYVADAPSDPACGHHVVWALDCVQAW